jgi:hypothetical protein
MLQRTISTPQCCAAQSRVASEKEIVMLKAVLRFIEAMMRPGAEMLAAMPPSAVRQVLYSI